VGIAKGAGMIEPNLATMLSYILTDLDVQRNVLQDMLNDITQTTFNCLTIDGDQSTSDTVFAISSQNIPLSASDELTEFRDGLKSICSRLSEDIVFNGEGTQHVVRIHVHNAPSVSLARNLGRFVINSNLVKCAISGNDPNVGRIVGAIGSYLGSASAAPLLVGLKPGDLTQGLRVTLGGLDIYSDGAFQLSPAKEKLLSDYMLDAQLFPNEIPEHDRNYPPHRKMVEIEIFLGGSQALSSNGFDSVVLGSDLTKEYVEINADYRS